MLFSKIKHLLALALPLYSRLFHAQESSIGIYPIHKNNAIGFIDSTGKIIVRPKFDIEQPSIGTGRDDLIIIRKNKKIGIINNSGKIIITPKFDANIGSFNFNNGHIAAYFLQGKCGYITDQGKKITQNIYDDCGVFQEQRARVKLNEKWALINESGVLITDFKFDYIDNFSEGLAAFKLNGKYGYIDLHGKFAIQPTYGFAINFSSGLARIGSMTEKPYYFIDHQGNKVLNTPYDHVYPFIGNFAVVRKDNDYFDKYGIIDKQGKLYIDLIYTDIIIDDHDLLALVKVSQFEEMRIGILNLKTKQYIIEPKFESISLPYYGLVFFKQNGKFGWMNDHFEVVIPAKFDNIIIGFGKNNLARVKIANKDGYINRNGEWISDYSLSTSPLLLFWQWIKKVI